MTQRHPRVLKDFNLFIDGEGYIGRAEEVTLPVLEMNTDEYRGAGMDAPIDIDVGLNKLRVSLSLKDFDDRVHRVFAKPELPITVRGEIQAQGEPSRAVLAQMRGMFTKVDPGTWQTGSPGKLAGEGTLTFYKLTINGREAAYIDIMNTVRRIDGVDHLADRRAILGL